MGSEPPPLLREALAAVGARMGIAVEIKDPRIVEGVLADIRDAQMAERALLWSYSEQVVKSCVRRAPEIEVSLLRDTRTTKQHLRFLGDAAALGARGLSIAWGAVDGDFAAEVRRRGLSLYSMCEAVRPDPDTAQLLRGLITDWPAEARAALTARPGVALPCAADSVAEVTWQLRRVHARGTRRYLEMPAGERRETVDAASRGVLERNWVPSPGFTMPARRKYPWMWLWDSCFHAIAWSALGDPRSVTELESVLSTQLPSGFVPHMAYPTDPQASLGLWHAAGRSDITQPPMYGHALRVLAARGFEVAHMYGPAIAGLEYLLEHRRDPESGLIRVLHPWEAGWDDSPRWDGWQAAPFNERRWIAKKRELVGSIQLRDGAAWANPGFDVASAGFSALVAFNARELGETAANPDLLARASALAAAIDRHWVDSRRTWSDVCIAGPHETSAVRTLDALFAVLVSDDEDRVDRAFAEIFHPRAFWRPHGPAGVAADEPSYAPGRYWRGDAWPQELYLLMVAARSRGRHEEASRLAEKLVLGCIGSGYSERWNPETGAGLGARSQGWAALAAEALRVLQEGRNANGPR